MGRLFDYHLVEMYEFGIDPNTYQSIKSFARVNDDKCRDAHDKSYYFGSKPGLLFQGESFQNDPLLQEMRAFLLITIMEKQCVILI